MSGRQCYPTVKCHLFALTVVSYNDIWIPDAESVNELEAILEKDDVLLLLSQAGFTNEFVTLKNKYRACQCITVHSLCVQNTERGAAANEDWHREYFTFTISTNV